MGRDGKLVDLDSLPPQTSINFSGFQIGETWRRPVSWHLSIKTEGEIVIKFEKDSISHIAIYFTDGDSFWRMGKIHTGDTIYTSDQAYNGRWLVFPVTEKENNKGVKSLGLRKFTGNSLAISSVAFLAKN